MRFRWGYRDSNGPKESGKWWTDKNRQNGGHETTCQKDDGTIVHYAHQLNEAPKEGWQYDPATGETKAS